LLVLFRITDGPVDAIECGHRDFNVWVWNKRTGDSSRVSVEETYGKIQAASNPPAAPW